jgi:hypothetical protein
MFQEPPDPAWVESVSAAEVGELSHELTSMAAAISTDPAERNPVSITAAGFLGREPVLMRCVNLYGRRQLPRVPPYKFRLSFGL